MEELKPKLEKQLDNLREPFAAFIGAQTTASAFLLLALVAALVIANSEMAGLLEAMRDFTLGVVYQGHIVEWSLLHLVNDGLIAIFFFLIGLEVKRELLAGELQQRQRVALLMSAALGGMLAPAGLYLAVNSAFGGGVSTGWGIPMATDTALAIGVLAALSSRVPRSVVAFLVGIAIVDDIGAILVIALVYTHQLDTTALGIALALLSMLLLLNQAGVRHPLMYILSGIALWAAIVQSGMHASIAGVIVAATVPARPRIPPRHLKKGVRKAVAKVNPDAPHGEVLGNPRTHEQIAQVERIAQAATTPLRRWENSLELPVALLILPLFAFLNAGVVISAESLRHAALDPVALGIVAGLALGKPVGLILGVRLSESLGLAVRPKELTDMRLLGLGLLAGVGFTMSTFIAHLALSPQTGNLDAAKLAIVFASAVSAVAGYTVLRRSAS